ncbi:hypothetical protein BDI4_300070 [Burkholderia diffusa]|nr:hypothetical protein BDI4_300070 [Burkholderia diffusa]
MQSWRGLSAIFDVHSQIQFSGESTRWAYDSSYFSK